MFTTLFTFKTYLERLTYSGFVDLLSETLSVAVLFVSKQDLTVFFIGTSKMQLVFKPEYRVLLFVKFSRISDDRKLDMDHIVCGTMPHSLTQETQFDYVVFVFEIAEMETIQTDIINYVQYHLDIPVFVSTRIIQNRTIQKPL